MSRDSREDALASRERCLLLDPEMPRTRSLAEVSGDRQVEVLHVRSQLDAEGPLPRGLRCHVPEAHVPESALVIGDASTTVLRARSQLGPKLRCALNSLTDKGRFRSSLQGMPDTVTPGSAAVRRAELPRLASLGQVRRRIGAAQQGSAIVLKPRVGSSSALVCICVDDADWEDAQQRVAAAPPCGASFDAEWLVLEEYVEGTELAVDFYYDASGRPVLLGVYLHPFLNRRDVRDTVYRTSPATSSQYRPLLEARLWEWNQTWQLRRFPAHVEVRVCADGRLFPIEVNPLRFGLLTADVTRACFGFNPYRAFFEELAPDWDELECKPALGDDSVAVVVGCVPGAAACARVDWDRLRERLQALELEILHEMPMPSSERPYVCAAYVRGRAADIDAVLHLDFGAVLS